MSEVTWKGNACRCVCERTSKCKRLDCRCVSTSKDISGRGGGGGQCNDGRSFSPCRSPGGAVRCRTMRCGSAAYQLGKPSSLAGSRPSAGSTCGIGRDTWGCVAQLPSACHVCGCRLHAAACPNCAALSAVDQHNKAAQVHVRLQVARMAWGCTRCINPPGNADTGPALAPQ